VFIGHSHNYSHPQTQIMATDNQ